MRQPLRSQILLPAAALLIAAVCINVLFAALWSSRRSTQQLSDRLQQVGQVLADTSFPRSPSILAKLQQLTGAEFAIWNQRLQTVVTSTLPPDREAALQNSLQAVTADPPAALVLENRTYRLSRIEPTTPTSPEVLYLLLDERTIASDRWTAIVPTLTVGLVSLVLLVPLMLGVSHSIGRRIESVHRQVLAVAEGNYETVVDAVPRDDEVHGLLESVNELASRLRDLQQQIKTTERGQLLAQFAGGMAHQLRNAITGAKLAVQLHQRRCPMRSDDESLSVALKQLSLTEQQLRGLLSLGRQSTPARATFDAGLLAREVVELVLTLANHVGVELTGPLIVTADSAAPPLLEGDRVAAQAAVLNLVLNAVEACGSGGNVELLVFADHAAVSWEVRDTGSGPSAAVASRMFDPFVTTKPEGVGLGLALARQVATDHGGELVWERANDWTVFRLTLPRLSVTRLETPPS